MVRLLFILLFSVSVCYGQANRFAGFGSRNTCPTEAQKFIDSSGITDATEQSAICTLVKQLKDSSLWTKMKLIYPIVGGTSSTVKWNLVNPVNSDAGYRMVFNGGWTYNSSYIQGNGSTGYANTFFNTSTAGLSKDSIAWGIYIENNVDNNASFGYIDGSFQGWSLYPRLANIAYSAVSKVYDAGANTDSRGFYIGTRTNQPSGKTFRNNSLLISHGSALVGSFANMYLGARNNNGSVEQYSTYQIGFFFVSYGLSDAEASTMYNIFTAFKTTLGR